MKTNDANARVFQVTDQLGDDAEVDVDAIAEALASVEGTDAEKAAYKRAVGFLLRRVAGEQHTSLNPFAGFMISSGDEDDAEKAKKGALLDAAGKFAQQAASRFPSDEAIQTWATSIAVSVKGEKEKATWLPKKRKYGLKAPGTVPAGAGTDSSTDSGGGTGEQTE